MGSMISEIFESFTTVIPALAKGIKDGFMELLYVDPEASTLVISDPVKFLLIFGGIGLAMGVFWKVFGLIRGRTKA